MRVCLVGGRGGYVVCYHVLHDMWYAMIYQPPSSTLFIQYVHVYAHTHTYTHTYTHTTHILTRNYACATSRQPRPEPPETTTPQTRTPHSEYVPPQH